MLIQALQYMVFDGKSNTFSGYGQNVKRKGKQASETLKIEENFL